MGRFVLWFVCEWYKFMSVSVCLGKLSMMENHAAFTGDGASYRCFLDMDTSFYFIISVYVTLFSWTNLSLLIPINSSPLGSIRSAWYTMAHNEMATLDGKKGK